MKKKKTGGKLGTVILILIFLVGLSLLLYPTVADHWNSAHQGQAIVDYNNQVGLLNPETRDRMLAQAADYNANLLDRADPFRLEESQAGLYGSMLALSSGDSAMAHIEIPSIGVSLPIFHGTGDAVLKKGIGHLEWSSLPVGGESSHCVISGHTGLPSSELLTNVNHMELGDVFYIHVLDETLKYTVDDITVVEPSDLSRLTIAQGKDYLTLVTCTPYGINSHRLLIRGIRTGQGQNSADRPAAFGDGETLNPFRLTLIALVTAVVLVFLIAALTLKKGVFVHNPPKDLQKEKPNGEEEAHTTE